jgi:small subunit ribosomal protein S9
MPVKHQTKKPIAHTAKPAIGVKKGKYSQGLGRRKTAVARVRIYKAEDDESGLIVVNERPLEKYFALANHQRTIRSPFERLNLKSLRVTVKVAGGGISAQAEAIRHGISRALVEMDIDLRKKLKQYGFLTRDPRMVERKKYGLKKARKAPQWSKR